MQAHVTIMIVIEEVFLKRQKGRRVLVIGVLVLTLVLVVVFDMTTENAAVMASQGDNKIERKKTTVLDDTSNHEKWDGSIGIEVVDNISGEEDEEEEEEGHLIDDHFLFQMSKPSNFTIPIIPVDNGGCLPSTSWCELISTTYPTKRLANETYKIIQRGPLRPRRHVVCNLQYLQPSGPMRVLQMG